MTDLAFIGLGMMGMPMARRLVEAGHGVAVWNRSRDKVDALARSGAKPAASPAAAARNAAIAMTCVSDTAAVEEVVFGREGVAEGIRRDALLIDFSSIDPGATRRFAAKLAAERGARWIDAPVSGGVPGAEKGTLVVMAGGEATDLERAAPVLKAVASRVTPMGPAGAGQTTKLCNQIIVGCSLAVIAEAIKLAQKSGIDATRLPECLKGGFADSLPLQIFGARMAKGEFDPPLAASSILLKDLDGARALAWETTTPLPMTALGATLFRMLQAQGRGKDDPGLLMSLLG